MANPTKHLVIVGDGSVGKTCLLYAFTNKGAFKADYEPTIYDKEMVELELDNEHHLLKLHDTAGQEDYERIRQVIYKEANCFILCFSLDNRLTFDNILSKWYPELKGFKVPIILVGTKSDLRNSPGAVQQDEAKNVCRRINGNDYLECSAKSYTFINEVIHAAVRSVKYGIPEQVIDDSNHCCSWNPFAACF